jgi:hypothetical protein
VTGFGGVVVGTRHAPCARFIACDGPTRAKPFLIVTTGSDADPWGGVADAIRVAIAIAEMVSAAIATAHVVAVVGVAAAL